MTTPAEPSTGVLVERIDYLRGDVRRVEEKVDNFKADIIRVERDIAARYITQDEFLPVKIIAYGFVALVCVGFVGLLLHSIGWKP